MKLLPDTVYIYVKRALFVPLIRKEKMSINTYKDIRFFFNPFLHSCMGNLRKFPINAAKAS